MDNSASYVELEVAPIPPDTIATAKAEVRRLIEQALLDAGHGRLIDDGQILIEVEKTFPTDEAIIVGLTFLAGVGLETYKYVLDVLRDRFDVKERKRTERARRKLR